MPRSLLQKNLTPPENASALEKIDALCGATRIQGSGNLAKSYTKVRDSLRRYPLPLKSDGEILALEGVGKCYSDVVSRALTSNDDQVIPENEREVHKLLVASVMIEFFYAMDGDKSPHESLPHDLPNNNKNQQLPAIRLTPGTSAWSILFVLFMLSDQYPNGMLRADICEAAARVSQFDNRCRIGNIRAIQRLIDGGLVKSIILNKKRPSLLPFVLPPQSKEDLSVPVPPPTKEAAKRTRFALTSMGIEAGQKIALNSDAPLLQLWEEALSTKLAVEQAGSARRKRAAELVIPNSTVKLDRFTSFKRTRSNNVPEEEDAWSPLREDKELPPSQILPAYAFRGDEIVSGVSVPEGDVGVERASDTKPVDIAFSEEDPAAKALSCEHSNQRSRSIRSKPAGEITNEGSSEELADSEGAESTETSGPDAAGCTLEEISLLVDWLTLASQEQVNEAKFELILFADYREVGTGLRGAKTALMAALTNSGVLFEPQRLSVADFVWVVRVTSPPGYILNTTLRRLANKFGAHIANEQERTSTDFVLPSAIERKAVPDLVNSLFDGRFDDQKYRLLRAPGISQVGLLIEGTDAEITALPSAVSSAVRTSIANTQIVSGFHVISTESIHQTASLLEALSKSFEAKLGREIRDTGAGATLRNLVLSKPLFSLWNRRCRKLTTVNDIYGRQLRVIEGFGDKTVELILAHMPKPTAIMDYLTRQLWDADVVEDMKVREGLRLPGTGEKARRIALNSKAVGMLRQLYAPRTVGAPPPLKEKKPRKPRKKKTDTSEIHP